MWRRRVGAIVVAAVLLAGCGGGGDDERSIAFVRTTAIAPEGQAAFLATLEEQGWEVGDDLTVLNDDPTAAAADEAEVTDLVEGFVDDGVDLIVALSTTATRGAVAVTDDVPVLTLSNDPVANGLVDDPRAPGGNVTGLAFRVPADRTIDVARRLAGDGATIGLLYPSEDPAAAPVAAEMAEAAAMLDVALEQSSWAADDEVADAVARLAGAGTEVVIIASSPTTVRLFPAIEEATTAAGIAVVANTNVAELATVVLAPDGNAAYEQLARQAARLLDGNDVREVPVEEPGAFRLLVRRGVADALGIAIPDGLLVQADEIVD